MLPFFTEQYANASGSHRFARQARQAVDEARDVVARVVGCHPNEVVFKASDGQSPLKDRYLSRRFREIVKVAGLPCHSLYGATRHSFAAMCRMLGMPLYQLRDELRHKDIKSTERYGRISASDRHDLTRELFRRGT